MTENRKHSMEDVAVTTENDLVERLRKGDEAAFEALIALYHSPLIRMALMYVSDQSTAEEVVQDTWIGVLRGLSRFEGRSSLKTWIFSILMNRAKTRAQREGRYIALEHQDEDEHEPSVAPERFYPAAHPYAHDWIALPANWDEIPEDRLVSQEVITYIQNAIATLPQTQREVITLRDVEGWGSAEVCNVLGISESNQRVLLHRARSKVRQLLEDYIKMFDENTD